MKTVIVGSFLKKNSRLWIATVLFIGIFFLYLRPVTDPDFGWHVAIGKYILENKEIPKTDIFSFSNPDYPYVYHSWLSEVLLYLMYNKFGLWGINILYSTIAALSFLIIFSQALIKNSKITLVSAFLLSPLFVYATNLRTQLFTFMGLSIVYYFYQQFQKNGSKSIYLTPLVFLVWVNLHGGFLLGLGFISLISAIYILTTILTKTKRSEFQEKKQKSARLIMITLLSFVASLINPFGVRAFSQGLTMVTKYFASSTNLDLSPLVRPGDETWIYGIILFILTIITVRAAKTIDIKEKILVVVLFALSLKMNRYSLVLIVVFASNFVFLINNYKEKIINIVKPEFYQKMLVGLLYLVVTFLFLSVGLIACEMPEIYRNEEVYARSTKIVYPYPYRSVEYLKENGVKNNMLNDYNWAGYLIWKLPENKVFVDGRMDYFIVDGEPFTNTYQRIINLYPSWQEKMDEFDINTILLQPNTPLVQHLKKSSDWKIVNEDKYSVVLVKESKL